MIRRSVWIAAAAFLLVSAVPAQASARTSVGDVRFWVTDSMGSIYEPVHCASVSPEESAGYGCVPVPTAKAGGPADSTVWSQAYKGDEAAACDVAVMGAGGTDFEGRTISYDCWSYNDLWDGDGNTSR